MRRYNNVESDIEEESPTAELERTLNILLPIRRQRLSRSERLQREQERALRQVQEQEEQAEVTLVEEQQRYREIRDSFDDNNLGQQRTYQLERAIQHEQQASDRVGEQRNHLLHLGIEEEAQQQRVVEAQQETRLRQRDVEKLEYLLEQVGGLA